MKKLSKGFKILIAVVAIGLPGILFAQPGGPQDDCIEPDDVNDNLICPLDGGVSLLVAAGIAFGLKKGYDKKKTAEY